MQTSKQENEARNAAFEVVRNMGKRLDTVSATLVDRERTLEKQRHAIKNLSERLVKSERMVADLRHEIAMLNGQKKAPLQIVYVFFRGPTNKKPEETVARC